MTQKTATIQEAQHDLPALLKLVETGTEVLLVEGGKTLARLIPTQAQQLDQRVSSALGAFEPLPEGFWCS